jgi:hypothetical protein
MTMTANLFRFYWNDGTTTVWEAETVEEAWKKAGYGSFDMKNLDFHQENVYQQTHAWIEDKQIWAEIERLPELEPKKGLYGDDLLKAMELEKFYPSDSHFSDDVSQYGYAGILERLIAHATQWACYASEDENELKGNAEFKFYKNISHILLQAVEDMQAMGVPATLVKDQPYGDGKL